MKQTKAVETRLQTYKRITDGIRQFINHSVNARNLIQEAKRLEIWKEKWSSWQEYCEKEFGTSRQRSYQLLEVADTIDEISSVNRVDTESGKNKEILDKMTYRQAKALSGLPTPEKARVFHAAVAAQNGKPPKPETINGVRKTLAKPEPQRDRTGYPIPETLLPDWNRATQQAMGWIRAFDAIHRQVMELHGTDFALAKINKSTLEAEHSNYRQQLKQALPHAICITCEGVFPHKCKACNPCEQEPGRPIVGVGLGWVNKRFWEDCVPMDIRKIREKAYGTNSFARLSA